MCTYWHWTNGYIPFICLWSASRCWSISAVQILEDVIFVLFFPFISMKYQLLCFIIHVDLAIANSIHWKKYIFEYSARLKIFLLNVISECLTNYIWFVSFFFTENFTLGRFTQDQHLLLGMGWHVSFYKHNSAVASWRAEWLWLLCVSRKSRGGRSESKSMHCNGRWSCLWKTCR